MIDTLSPRVGRIDLNAPVDQVIQSPLDGVRRSRLRIGIRNLMPCRRIRFSVD